MLKRLISSLQAMRKHRSDEQQKRYRIIEEDLKEGNYVFKSEHSRVTFAKHLPEIFANTNTIRSLLPADACYLGIRYGQFMQYQLPFHVESISQRVNLTLSKSNCRYQIDSELRSGMICYKDLITDEKQYAYPEELINKPEEIGKFEAIQACYIGILASLGAGKRNHVLPNITALNLTRQKFTDDKLI